MAAYRSSLLLLLAVLLAGLSYRIHLPDHLTTDTSELLVSVQDSIGGEYEVRLDTGNGYEHVPLRSFHALGVDNEQVFTLSFPSSERRIRAIRIDTPPHPGRIHFSRMELRQPGGHSVWQGAELRQLFTHGHNILLDTTTVEGTVVQAMGDDPYVLTGPGFSPTAERSYGELLVRLLQLLLPVAMAIALVLGLMLAARAHARTHPSANGINSFYLLLLLDLWVGIAVFHIVQPIRGSSPHFALELEVDLPRDDSFEAFHARTMDGFQQATRGSVAIEGGTERQTVRVPVTTDEPFVHLRFDPGSNNPELTLHASWLRFGDQRLELPLHDWAARGTVRNGIRDIHTVSEGLRIITDGNDPYLVLAMDMRDHCKRLQAAEVRYAVPALVALIIVLLLHVGVARSQAWSAFLHRAERRDTLMACTVLLLLFLPLLTLVAPGLQPERDFDEKRKLSAPVPLRADNLGVFADRWDAYYRDHFGFRRELFRLNAMLHVRVLHTSHLPDKVQVGRNGWLYQMGNNVEDAYRGIPLFSEKELDLIVRFYEKRQAQLAEHGIRYYLMMPPIAASLHPEYLPTRLHRISERTWLDQVQEHFATHSTVPFIDVRPQLREARKARPIYFTTDIHWNTYGAYWGYKALIERIAEDMPSVGPAWPATDFRYEERVDPNGDMAHIIGLNDVLTRVDLTSIPLRPRQAGFQENRGLPTDHFFLGVPTTWTHPDSTLPHLLMFHDSFGLYMKPLMAEHFRRSTYVWSNMYLPDVVAREKPDVVVQEMLEMFTPHLLKDSLASTIPW